MRLRRGAAAPTHPLLVLTTRPHSEPLVGWKRSRRSLEQQRLLMRGGADGRNPPARRTRSSKSRPAAVWPAGCAPAAAAAHAPHPGHARTHARRAPLGVPGPSIFPCRHTHVTSSRPGGRACGAVVSEPCVCLFCSAWPPSSEAGARSRSSSASPGLWWLEHQQHAEYSRMPATPRAQPCLRPNCMCSRRRLPASLPVCSMNTYHQHST